MNQKISKKTVVWMAKTGFHPTAIADRLKCSRRQVDRILKAEQVTAQGFLKDFENEHELWAYYRNVWGEPYARIAERFGVSRQAVQKHFNYEPEGFEKFITQDGRRLIDIETAEYEDISRKGAEAQREEVLV